VYSVLSLSDLADVRSPTTQIADRDSIYVSPSSRAIALVTLQLKNVIALVTLQLKNVIALVTLQLKNVIALVTLQLKKRSHLVG
jgi:hypothetical protein